jgi:hypothetical protein
MKIIVQLLLMTGFALGAASSGAAPRAAEDPSAVVISTTASAPRVKREAPQQTKSATKPKPAKHSSTKTKKKTKKAH